MNSVNSKELKIGVVGLGKMGVMHACLLNIFPNVTLSALCDKSWLMKTIAKRAFRGTMVTDSLDELSGLGLDAVYVLTPIPSHYFIIKEIYNKGIASNVFVEKTLSSNYAHSEELCKLSDSHQGINMVGYMKRFGVTFNQAKKLLDHHTLGEVTSFNAYAFSSDFADVPEGSMVSKARGGALEDLGSHVTDLAIWFFGDLDVAYAKVDSKTVPGSEDSITFDVTNQTGLNGKFEVSWCKAGYRMPEFGLAVEGTKGKLSVNDDEVKLNLNNASPKTWYRHGLNDNVGFFLGGQEYYRENEHFIACLVSGTGTKSDFKSALRVDRLLDNVRRKASNV